MLCLLSPSSICNAIPLHKGEEKPQEQASNLDNACPDNALVPVPVGLLSGQRRLHLGMILDGLGYMSSSIGRTTTALESSAFLNSNVEIISRILSRCLAILALSPTSHTAELSSSSAIESQFAFHVKSLRQVKRRLEHPNIL